jgi:hypothetical protein
MSNERNKNAAVRGYVASAVALIKQISASYCAPARRLNDAPGLPRPTFALRGVGMSIPNISSLHTSTLGKRLPEDPRISDQ